VSAVIPGQPDPQNLGTIELALFPNPGGLDARLGRNLFLETTASGTPITGEPGGAEGGGTIEQSFLENSNVQVVEEIIHLIIAQRAYQANSNVIQTADEMLGLANSLKR
jgi:flagellar basal-body rod protein FlgG